MIEGNETSVLRHNRRYDAAQWLVEWQHRAESDSPGDDTEFLQRWQQWSADDDNGATYDQIASTLPGIKNCRRPLMPSEAECAADEYDGSVPVEEWLARKRRPAMANTHRPRATWRQAWLFAPVAVAAVAGVMFFQSVHKQAVDHGVTYETGSGENRKILMPDGSTLTLGAKTAISTYYTDRRRLVVLNSGEGFFNVMHDPTRPFIVVAGRGSIKAIGTSFNVLRNYDRVVVTVIEGTVDVAPREPSMEDRGPRGTSATPKPQWLQARLTQGQEMWYAVNGTASPVTNAGSGRATSWREGRLQYSRESLAHVVMDVNRYWNRQIIYDREAGELRYTGDVLEGNIDGWVHNLHEIFPVDVLDTDAAHVLVRLHRDTSTHESQRSTERR